MNNLKRIDFLFCSTGLIILAIGFTFFTSTLDVNIHDTYLVIEQTHITLTLAFTFFLISLIYFSFIKFSKPLRHRLGQIHYVTTTLTLLIFIFPPTSLFQPRRYTPDTNLFDKRFDINEFLVIVSLSFLLGQLVFIVNIFLTLFGRKKTTP